MKKLIILFALFACIGSGIAQDYYTGVTEVTAGGITYKVEQSGYSFFKLKNIDNTMPGSGAVYRKDGTRLYADDIPAVLAKRRPGSIEKAFMETFSKEEFRELQKANRRSMTIYFYIDSEGKVFELIFTIFKGTPAEKLPPAKFALLEKNLKKYTTFELTDFAKELTHIEGFSFINFAAMTLIYPPDTEPVPNPAGPDAPVDPGSGTSPAF